MAIKSRSAIRFSRSETQSPFREEYKTDVMQGTLREIETVPCWLLVADIRGFTPLSRQMQSQDLDVFVGAWILSCKEIIENQPRHN